jgi:hypothetical protein
VKFASSPTTYQPNLAGRAAAISVITRSGKNTPHGSAFWFHRNDNLDAATTLKRAAPPARANSNETTSGHSAVHPSRIAPSFLLLPGAATNPAILGEQHGRDPQLRDFVLRTRPNSIAAQLPKDFPPQLNPADEHPRHWESSPGVRVFNPADGIPDIGEVFIPIPGFVYDDQFSVRLDHTFNGGNDTLSGRYSINDREEQRPGDNSARAFRVDFLEKDTNISLNHTHIFSPQAVNDLRLGYNYDPQINRANFPEVPHVQFSVAGRSVSQFSQTFGYVFPLDFRLHTYQIYDAVSLTRGNHGLKIGGRAALVPGEQ